MHNGCPEATKVCDEGSEEECDVDNEHSEDQEGDLQETSESDGNESSSPTSHTEVPRGDEEAEDDRLRHEAGLGEQSDRDRPLAEAR